MIWRIIGMSQTGFYIDLDELPGKIVENEKDLIASIKTVNYNIKNDEKYIEFNEKYNYLEDGKASERVVNKIFMHKEGTKNETKKIERKNNNIDKE